MFVCLISAFVLFVVVVVALWLGALLVAVGLICGCFSFVCYTYVGYVLARV